MKKQLKNVVLIDYENKGQLIDPGKKGILLIFVSKTMGVKGKEKLLAKIKEKKVSKKNYMIIQPKGNGKNYNDDMMKMIVMYLEYNYKIKRIKIVSHDKGFDNLTKMFDNISVIAN